jgi:hypothetical protein
MDSVPSASTLARLVTTSPAAPDAGINEIGEVILAEHARILRLFAALHDLVRRADPSVSRLALAQVWTRLAALLVTHTRAEEEICFPPVCGTGARTRTVVEAAAADHIGIRKAVEQARLLEVGSARWWQLITGAHMACAEHFASEERGLLPALCDGLPPGTGKVLARQWGAFAVAQADGFPATGDGHTAELRSWHDTNCKADTCPNPARAGRWGWREGC